MSKIISFISQKGGVGKSTLARALAVECAKADLKIKIIDLDSQQKTIVDWNKIREQSQIKPSIVVETFPEVKLALANSGDCDLLIFDSPARTSQGTLILAKYSDIIIQPAGASRDDLVPAIREFNALVKAGIPREKLFFALNHISSDNEETSAREFIEQSGYSVLEGCVLERPSYRQSQNEGKAITEVIFKSLQSKANALLQSIVDKL